MLAEALSPSQGSVMDPGGLAAVPGAMLNSWGAGFLGRVVSFLN